MARNTLMRHRTFSRDPEEGGGGGGTGGSGGEGGSGGNEGAGKEGSSEGDKGGKEYVPPATQEEFDRIVTDRVNREKRKYADYDTVKDKASKWDALERESQTDQERREREFRAEALQEAMSIAVPAAVRAEFKAAAKEHGMDKETLTALLEDLDLRKYANDKGEPDEDKIDKKVKALAPVKGGSGRNGTGPGFGQGNGHSQSKGRPGEAGLAEAERRFGKAKANTGS